MKAKASGRLDVPGTTPECKRRTACKPHCRVRMAPANHAPPALDVQEQRRIAAVPPFLDRAVCDGAVKTFSEDDVLEVEGRSYRNLESRVMRADVNNFC